MPEDQDTNHPGRDIGDLEVSTWSTLCFHPRRHPIFFEFFLESQTPASFCEPQRATIPTVSRRSKIAAGTARIQSEPPFLPVSPPEFPQLFSESQGLDEFAARIRAEKGHVFGRADFVWLPEGILSMLVASSNRFLRP